MTSRRAAAAAAVLLLLTACAPAGSPSPGVSASGRPSPNETPFGTTTPDESDAASPSASIAIGTTYTVRAGDTLSSIARAWGTSVAQLQAWNAASHPSLVTDPNTLQAGWVLVVAGDPGTTPLPTVTPTLAPTPAPSGCRAGDRVAAGAQQTFATVPNAGHGVALTLDMGGRLDPGLDILNLLIANHVCATIFPTGAMAQTTQGQQVMAVIRAHPELFEIGNHTMHHCNLVAGGGGSPSAAPCTGITPTADFIRRELTDAAAILEQFSGQAPVPYWRPPYGAVNQAVRDAAASVGYTKTFMWDIDTIDWKPIADGGPTAQQIATKVVSNARDGSIVLMHLGGYETLDALAIMIPGLRDRGFLPTSLSDLLN
ncbi:MAG TPA: polysaccharide deacetylase family protein [Candidatus Limnocylindria bacterium]|jgi:peptidoglycan/xylan/chitin deacetylase (PgdA/CDA1 family)|nr:polysaccharide deacetylase family protein [Candidatus Limnocylindria bacterium]